MLYWSPLNPASGPKVIRHKVVRIVGQRKVSPSPVLARRMAALDWLRYMLNYMHNV